jgi:hypothetical protein
VDTTSFTGGYDFVLGQKMIIFDMILDKKAF